MNQKMMQQLKQAKNKEEFMMSAIMPENQNTFKEFQQMNQMQQAQKIADYCNQKGITKEQLSNFIKRY